MKTRHAFGSVALAAGLLLSSSASLLAADGWGMPNLNPFAKKSKLPTSASVSDQGRSSGFSLLPKWPGSKSSKPTAARGPSTWTRVTTGTKSLVSKTTDALTPWDNDKKTAAKPQGPTGSFNPFTSASSKKQDNEKKSFLPSWTMGEDKPKQPTTVNEWLAQPKPEI